MNLRSISTLIVAGLNVCWDRIAWRRVQRRQTKPRPPTWESRRAALQSLLDEEWQYELRSDPEMATTVGETRYNDRLTDRSPQFQQSDVEAKRKFLARFEAIDGAGFPQQDALSHDLMIRSLRQEIERAQFKPWEMPVEPDGRTSS